VVAPVGTVVQLGVPVAAGEIDQRFPKIDIKRMKYLV
jgi:hypothetical protein